MPQMVQLTEADFAPAGRTGTDTTDATSGQQLAWLAKAARGDKEDPYKHLLIARFALLNMIAFAMLGAAWVNGLLDVIVAADRTRIVVVIGAVFLGGLGICAARILRTSRELDRVRSFNPLEPSLAADYLAQIRGLGGDGRANVASAFRLKLSQRIQSVKQIANSLVLLGLVGTVIGFIIALSGVDPKSASDANSIAPMVGRLIEGMSVALYTTLVGTVLNIWMTVNYHLLAGGTAKLIAALVEFGERHGRS